MGQQAYLKEICIARDFIDGEYIYYLRRLEQVLANKNMQLCYVFHQPKPPHVEKVLKELCIWTVDITGEKYEAIDINMELLTKVLNWNELTKE